VTATTFFNLWRKSSGNIPDGIHQGFRVVETTENTAAATADRTGAPLLEMRGISKAFPGVQALDNVSLTLRAGEVLALMGENGAGKSTLIKVLAGIHRPDAGEIRIDGRPVVIGSVHDALAAGVSVIHQELILAENLDVAANIFLGREPRWGGPLGLINRRQQRRDALTWMKAVGLDIDPGTPVGDLSTGRRQMVEIAKALSLRSRILVMDEPTASLSARESETLFALIEDLRKQGVGIIYVSHRMPEVARLADRTVVLRDGRNAGELGRQELVLPDNVIRLMVGRELKKHPAREKPPSAAADLVLAVEDLRFPGCAAPASFELRRGEILGLAGLVGAGRTELASAIFGVNPSPTGRIRVSGREVRIGSPADAVAAGIALVPEDRKAQGLVLEMTVRENTSLPGLARMAGPAGLLPYFAERTLAREQIDALRIRTPGPEQLAKNLSGGNQQKVVLAKWLALNPAVLILDEPTRGIDVGAKGEIYALMGRLADAGMGILMISSDMEEVIALSDRVMVMHEGRISGFLEKGRIAEEEILRLAAGIARDNRSQAEG
jgi:ribose transport system ATP-binding protein